MTLAWATRRSTQIRLAIRITVAGMLAFIFSRYLGLTQGYPAVITAVIVTQGSVGASVRAMFDRFIGSMGGAIWGVAMLMAFSPTGATPEIMLAATLAPLAVLVALKPAYRPALITAIILMFSTTSEAIPLTLATQRMLGIALGSVVALVISLTVLPSRAHATLADAVGKALTRMADLFDLLMKSPHEANRSSIQDLHADIRGLLAQAETASDAANQERATYLTGGPDPRPLCRTLRRLYHDLAMIGRATENPLPSGLAESTAALANAISDFLRAAGRSATTRGQSPALDVVTKTLADYSAAITQLRQAGYTRGLSTDELARMFGLTFALEQLHRNLIDVAERANDLAAGSNSATRMD